MPHNHKKKIAKFYYADAKLINQAINVACETQKKWDKTPFTERLEAQTFDLFCIWEYF